MSAAMALAVWATLSAAATTTTLWDRDEPRFARAAVEMVRSGNGLVPTFNGEVRPHKPILIYWLMSVPVRWLGPTELAVRACSPVAIAVTAWLTWRLARLLLSPGGARLAMLLLVSMPLVVLEGTAATADAVLLMCVTGALTAFAHALRLGPTRRYAAWLALSLAGGLLVKGPVGLVIPLAVVAATLVGHGGAAADRPRLVRHVLGAAALGVVAFLAWAIPADRATGGRFLRDGLGRQFVDRLVTPMEGHGGFPLVGLPFYALVVALAMAPASAYLPAAVAWLRRGGGPLARLLACWIVVPFAMVGVVATVLPHYVLPIAPAVAVAGAAAVEAATADRGGAVERWVARATALAGVVVTVWVVGAAVAAGWVPFDGLARPVVAVAIVLIGAALAARRMSPAAAARTLIAGTLAAELLAAFWLLPKLEALKPVPPLARGVHARVPPEVPIAFFEVGMPSLDFYLDRPRTARLLSDDAVRAWAGRAEPGLLVTTRASIDRMGDALGSKDVVASARGWDWSKPGRMIELVAIRRDARLP